MLLTRRISHYQQLTEFERDRVIGLREGGFSFCDIAERLGWNVSTVFDCWEQWSIDGWSPVARIPLTPSHCHLRHQWCHVKAHSRTEWRSLVFSKESRFYLGASDGRMLVKRRPGERLQPNCLRPRRTGLTPVVMI
ncbi:transposable element Tcb1 transposase [Trichonephila clavipes]|nr:transposable element Tcb1 transposase [Trichonephila clavipes]